MIKIVEWLTISGMMEVDWTYDELNNDRNKRNDYLYYNTYVLFVKILFEEIKSLVWEYKGFFARFKVIY